MWQIFIWFNMLGIQQWTKQTKNPCLHELILLVKSSSHKDIIISLPFRHRAVLEPRPPVKSFTKHPASGQYSLAASFEGASRERALHDQWKLSRQLSSLSSPSFMTSAESPPCSLWQWRLHLLCHGRASVKIHQQIRFLKDVSACKIYVFV